MTKDRKDPLFDWGDVRRALDRLRRAEPLGDTPLRHLAWVNQRLGHRGPTASSVELDVALGSALAELIEQNLGYLRRVEGLSPSSPEDRALELNALQADFAQANTELEAWSALYYRYIRPDLNLQLQDIALLLKTDPRQLRRRLTHGYRRLTERLGQLEAEARASSRHLWLHLKLPSMNYTELFGRDEVLTSLYSQVCTSSPPNVTVLVGPGGIGKTTLAHALSLRLIQEECFEDFVWLTLDELTAYPSVLAMLARSLGYPHLAEDEPGVIEAGLRLRLSTVPTLVVIDNADHMQGYTSLPSQLNQLVEPGHLLLTARSRPAPEAPVHLFSVSPLSRSEIAALLRSYARLQRTSQAKYLTETALDVIYAAIGGNPLAGRLVASQLAFLPLERILESLATLEVTHGEKLSERLFVPTWEALSDSARQVAIALCLLPPEGAYWHDLFATADLPVKTFDTALRELITASLVDVSGEEPRYVMHALTRRFIDTQTGRPPWETDYRRLLRRAIARKVQVKAPPEADFRELSCALTLLHRQAELGEQLSSLGTLITQVSPAARRAGQWLAWRKVLLAVVKRLEDGSDPHTWARALLELGVAYRWLGETVLAESMLQKAIEGFGHQGDFAGQAEALLELGQLSQVLGQTGVAYEAYQRAAATAQRHNIPPLRRRALNGLAALALSNNRMEEALNLLQQAMGTFGDEEPDGHTLSMLGTVRLHAGDTAQAIKEQKRALAWFQENSDLPGQARAHFRLGMACHADRRQNDALRYLQDGLHLMRTLGDALGQARILTNLGTVHSENERWQAALSVWQEAIALQERLDDQVGMTYTWYNLADLHWKLGHYEAARESLVQARILAKRLNLLSVLAQIDGHPLSLGPPD